MAGATTSPAAAAVAGSFSNGSVVETSEAPPAEMADVESARMKLRQRWELASVLNFLHVFRPIVGKDLKISAEDVETAIIERNSNLAQIHIALLKDIVPSSQAQTLKSPDGWMVVLSKTLLKWWHWVAEGDFPLSGTKGEEISVYKELEPTARVVVLKALCEVRADQFDVASYINEKMKNGTDISYFRKDKLASDGSRVAFWYDGNETIGHRLYKEVYFFEKGRGKSTGTVPAVSCQWETLATNLEEFNKIVNEFSTSELKWEVALAKSVEMDVIPVLKRQHKKVQKALYRQQREQLRWNGFRHSVGTRSFRSNKPVDYRYDSYDKAITEAIKYSNKRKTSEEPRKEEKPSKKTTRASDGSNNSPTSSRDSESTETDTEKSNPEGSDDADDHEEYVEKEEDAGKEDDSEEDEGKAQRHKKNMPPIHRSEGMRFSKRLAGVPGHIIPESLSLGSKNRLRQRPSVNTAAGSLVVPDSEDESP